MPRKAAITPNRHLHTVLPPDLLARLDLYLWSEVEGRVPKGAYQEFFCTAIRDFFGKRTIDLAPLIPEAPLGQFFISGTPESLAMITNHLKGDRNA